MKRDNEIDLETLVTTGANDAKSDKEPLDAVRGRPIVKLHTCQHYI
jgi:hypothetical protein